MKGLRQGGEEKHVAGDDGGIGGGDVDGALDVHDAVDVDGAVNVDCAGDIDGRSNVGGAWSNNS